MEAVAFSEKEGLNDLASQVLVTLGTQAREQEEIAKAEEYFQRSASIAEHVADPEPHFRALMHLGGLYMGQQRVAEAVATLKQVSERGTREQELSDDSKKWIGISYYQLGKLAMEQHLSEDALRYGELALETLRPVSEAENPVVVEIAQWLQSLPPTTSE